MERAEFDKFADEYRSLHESSIAASGEAPEYFADYKMRDLAALIDEDGARTGGARFLDFGAGVGASVRHFRKRLAEAELVCVDVSERSLKLAASRFAGDADFVAFDGKVLPFADGTFDCAFAACVFHHIPHDRHPRLLKELWRVLRVGGQLMVYEHNPLNPLTLRAVNRCPFDDNAKLIHAQAMKVALRLAGFHDARIRYRVFFPHSLRWFRPLETSLTWLPLGAQYYACGRR